MRRKKGYVFCFFSIFLVMGIAGIRGGISAKKGSSNSMSSNKIISVVSQLDKVFVILDTASTAKNMRAAISSNHSGNLKTNDFQTTYQKVPFQYGNKTDMVMIAYTTEAKIPKGSQFQAMWVEQYVRTCENDSECGGFNIDNWALGPENIAEIRTGLRARFPEDRADLPYELRMMPR